MKGARLFAPRLRTEEPASQADIAVEQVGTSDADGQFAVTVPRVGSEGKAYVVAHASGLGVDGAELSASKKATEVTLRLPKDVPITGRVVNTENRPIAGVSVSVVGIMVPADDNLDNYLEGWLRNLRDNLASPRKRIPVGLDSITGAVTTDRDGRFTLHGAGAERIVQVSFSGGGVARSTPYVITRPGLDVKPYNAVLSKKENEQLRVLNRFLGMYPPTLTFVAEPGKVIEGVVTDAASGKPVAGCRLFAHTGYGEGVGSVADAKGKYRLEGIPKHSRGYGVSVLPPKGVSYLTRMASAPDTEGYARVHLDVTLVSGATVRGRVVDRQTGKGVAAGIRFAPLADNKFFGSRPGFDNYRHDRTMSSTDKDGRFQLITIPGSALVLVQVHQGETFHGQYLNPYRRATPDADHKKIFHYDADDDSWTLSSAGGLEFLSTENAVKVIDVKADGDTEVELFVDRGVTGRIKVQDPDGKPLAGAWVAGLADHWPITFHLPASEAKVYALDPKKPRTLAVFHPGKKLGGTATLRGDEKEPVVVRLAPVGSVSGRLMESDRTPLSRAEVSINPRSEIGRELYRFAMASGKPVHTDADGRFTLSGVVPGLPFYLGIRKGEHFYGGKPKIGLQQCKPGQKLELGERTMEVLR
jgi:hypothetical protein